MPKIDRAHKNYLTPESCEETHLNEIFCATLPCWRHTLALQHGGQNYFLLISCQTFDAYAPINVKPAGGRQGIAWGFDRLCWPWGRVFDWSCSPRGGDIWIFLRPTWRFLTADSDEKDLDRTYVSRLHASRMRNTVWKSWRPTGTSESLVDFTLLSSNFVCFSVFLINWTS